MNQESPNLLPPLLTYHKYKLADLQKDGLKFFSEFSKMGDTIISAIKRFLQNADIDENGVIRKEFQSPTTTFNFYAKAYRTASSIKTLWNAKQSEDSSILLRTIVEIYFELDFYLTSPAKNEKKYQDYKGSRITNEYKGKIDHLRKISRAEEVISDDTRMQLDALMNTPYKNSWHDLSVKRLAQSGKNSNELLYLNDYVILSDQIHGNATSNTALEKEWKTNKMNVLFHNYPFDPYVSKTTFEYMLRISKLVATFNNFRVNLDKHEEKIRGIFSDIYAPSWHSLTRG